MIRDQELIMSEAQVVTTDAASTNYVNQSAAGDAYDALWFIVRCAAAAGSASGTATLTIKLETDSDSGFATDLKALYTSPAFTVAQMTANTNLIKVRVPVGALQYLRTYYDNGTEALNAGSFDAYFVADARL